MSTSLPETHRDVPRGAVGVHVRVPKAGELIANHLRRQIVRGQLREGDALLPRTTSCSSSRSRGRRFARHFGYSSTRSDHRPPGRARRGPRPPSRRRGGGAVWVTSSNTGARRSPTCCRRGQTSRRPVRGWSPSGVRTMTSTPGMLPRVPTGLSTTQQHGVGPVRRFTNCSSICRATRLWRCAPGCCGISSSGRVDQTFLPDARHPRVGAPCGRLGDALPSGRADRIRGR